MKMIICTFILAAVWYHLCLHLQGVRRGSKIRYDANRNAGWRKRLMVWQAAKYGYDAANHGTPDYVPVPVLPVTYANDSIIQTLRRLREWMTY
jgi:hypothetical protein